jgi:hypothetical protein
MDQRDLFRIYRLLFIQKCANLKKKWERRDRVVLKSGYSLGEAYGNLRKCWKGYVIAKNDGDEEKMIHYAEGIQKFQYELGLAVEDFSHLGLCAPSSPSQEAIEEQDEANDRFEYGATYDDAPNITDKAKGKEYEFDNYEDYVSNLPMDIEPISEDEFYKGHK